MQADKLKLKQVVGKIDSLPTLPIVVTHILQLVESPDTSATDINQVISADQALTAKILKLVNSAFYGFSRQISTVTQAIVILGFNTVKSLALSATVFEMFSGGGEALFDRTAFWEHSIGTGIAAQIIGKKIKYPQVEEAFIAGIIHDVGKVVLDQHLHDDFKKVIQLRDRMGLSLQEAEQEALGIDHTLIGKWLADKWNLPPLLQSAIAYHHDVKRSKDDDLMPSLVHLGDILARTKKIGSGGDDSIPPLQEEAWNRLKLQRQDLESILKDLDRDMGMTQDFIAMTKK